MHRDTEVVLRDQKISQLGRLRRGDRHQAGEENQGSIIEPVGHAIPKKHLNLKI